MAGRREAPRGLTDIVALVLLYAILAIAAYAFGNGTVLGGLGIASPERGVSFILLAAVPVALALIFALRLRRLIVGARGRAFGSRLKLRFFCYFAVLGILTALPQGLFLGRIAEKALEAPGLPAIRDALSEGQGMALDIYDRMLYDLEYTATRDLPGLLGQEPPEMAEEALQALAQRYPAIVALEVFASDGEPAAFAGSEAARLGGGLARGAGEGFLPKAIVGGVGFLRYLRPVGPGGGAYAAVLSSRLPEGFDGAAESISDALAMSEEVASYGNGYGTALAFYYAILVLPLLLLAFLFSDAAADRLVEPLRSLDEAARRASGGDFSARLLTKPRDELGDLVRDFNRMLEGAERGATEAERSGKLSAWQEIARKLAHELKNPLTPIKLSAERVLKRRREEPGRVDEILEKAMLAIIQEADGMNALLSEFRDFARLPEPSFEWANLGAVVDEAIAPYAAAYPAISYERGAGLGGIVLRADRAHMKQALGNLLANASEAMPSGGRVGIEAALVKKSDSRYCRLRIQDDGTGIPDDVRDQVFSPYFTTKSAGTGLGLSIVEHIVLEHGGTIWFETAPGKGTTFFLDFPLGS